jgi:hypothetical protein
MPLRQKKLVHLGGDARAGYGIPGAGASAWRASICRNKFSQFRSASWSIITITGITIIRTTSDSHATHSNSLLVVYLEYNRQSNWWIWILAGINPNHNSRRHKFEWRSIGYPSLNYCILMDNTVYNRVWNGDSQLQCCHLMCICTLRGLCNPYLSRWHSMNGWHRYMWPENRWLNDKQNRKFDNWSMFLAGYLNSY